MKTRAENEIAHGKKLLESGAEQIWGWGTPAGQVRALRRADWIIDSAQLNPSSRVIEIGCGTGIFTEIFARSKATIVALDISEELLVEARKRVISETVNFICMPFEKMETNEPFDAIIGSSVLHHLDIKPALNKIFRLLKPGGLMSFAEPNMLNPQIMVQKNIPWIKEKVGDSPDETAFVRWHLGNLLKKCGFKNIKIVPRDWLHPAVPTGMIGPMSWLGNFLEHVPVVREIAGSLYIAAQKP